VITSVVYDRETCGSWLASDSNLETTKNPPDDHSSAGFSLAAKA